jgi:hypothetical protein
MTSSQKHNKNAAKLRGNPPSDLDRMAFLFLRGCDGKRGNCVAETVTMERQH